MQKIEKMDTLKDLILKRCEIFKDKTAIIERNKKTNKFDEIKYKQIKEDVLNLGTAMFKKFKLQDEKVAVIGENSYKWFVTYMATVCGIGIIVPLDKELPTNEILNLINRSKSKCIVYSSKKKEIIDELRKELPEDMIYIEMDKDKSDDESFSFDELLLEGKELIDTGNHEYIDKKIDPNEFKILLFTSGTTSNSKGVMLSHNNITSNIYSIAYSYGEQTRLRFLSFLPIHHTYEFTITYLSVLSEGGSVGICEGLRYIIQNLTDMKPDCITCVPLLVDNIKKKILKTIKKENKQGLVDTVVKMSSFLGSAKTEIRRKIFKKIHDNLGGNLKCILVGAAPADKETIDVMEGLGFIILQGYGLTETSPLVSGTLVKNRKAGTVGTAIKNVEIRIDLKEDEIENSGEIMVKGPNVMLGYYEDEEETKKVLKKGWFYTGDIGYFDNQGNLVISGRTKNVIVTQNGKNIYPEELENFINKIPFVSESMVYGYDDAQNDIEVAVKVTLDEEYIEEMYTSNRPSDEQLHKIIWEEIKKINRKLVPYKAVKKLEIKNDQFEKTTTLKIKRFAEMNKNN
ncbi:MAG: AMP-binding protein [Clostridia bacterium]|nr:AMP-binding protein [Clostridia bacterium]MDD4386287.1 AMP-binding protein [Clostridia bacterium]